MKKVQFLAVAAVMIISSLGAATNPGTDEVDLDQLIKNVKEKLEKRRLEREQAETQKPSNDQDQEEIEYDETIEIETPTNNLKTQSSKVSPNKEKEVKLLSISSGRRRARNPETEVSNRSKVEYPEASFPKDAPVIFQPSKRRVRQAGVADREVSYQKPIVPTFEASSKRQKRLNRSSSRPELEEFSAGC